MKKLKIISSIFLMLSITSYVHAAAPNVETIINKMKNAHDAALDMAQQIEIHIQTDDKAHTKWIAGKAHKVLPSGKHVLIVLLEPDLLRGFGYLLKEKDNMTVDRWVYPPALGRTRQLIVPWNAYDTFLNTDFTFADLGFVNTSGEYKLLGEEMIDGRSAFKVQKIPESPIRFYSKIISWISRENHLPIRRDYYDVAGRLYKQQFFDSVISVSGVPIPHKVTMKNVQLNSSTIFMIKEVRTDLEMPDEIFDPKRLKYSASCPIWERVCLPSERVRMKQ